MTCIVAIKTESGVLFGIDSCISNMFHRGTMTTPKYGHLGPFFFAVAGSMRLTQIIANISWEEKDESHHDPSRVIFELTEKIRVECVRHGLELNRSENQILVAYKGELYYIDDTLSFFSRAEGFDTIGSGADFARGSLVTTGLLGESLRCQSEEGTAVGLQKIALTPRVRVELALRAAAFLSPSVGAPFTFIEV